VFAAATDRGLLYVTQTKKGLFKELDKKVKGNFVEDSKKFDELQNWLNDFYRGEPVKYKGPFDLRGTDFQKRVWEAIYKIPYGKLTSYGRIAKDIGLPKAARAVGNAVGANPLGPVIPCHRVVWSNGGIGGFGNGLEKKRKLLHIEGILPTEKGIPEKGIDLRQFFQKMFN